MFSVWTKPDCPFCSAAIEELEARGLDYMTVPHNTPEAIAKFKEKGYRTFPQIFFDGSHIGGYSDLVTYFESDDDF